MSDQVDVIASNDAAQSSFDGSHMINIQPGGIAGGVIQTLNGNGAVAQTLSPSDGIAVTSVGAVHTIGRIPPTDPNTFLQCPPCTGFNYQPGVITANFSGVNKILGIRARLSEKFPVGALFITCNVVAGALGKRIGFGVYTFDGLTLLGEGRNGISAPGLVAVPLGFTTIPTPGEDYLFCWSSDSAAAVLDFVDIATGFIAAFNAALTIPAYFEAANAAASGIFPAAAGALTPTTDLVPFGIFHL